MLKYLTKFTVDILPSVAATVIGAYIVNHYIVTKPDAPAVAGAAVSTAGPKATDGKPSDKPTQVSSLPEAGSADQQSRADGGDQNIDFTIGISPNLFRCGLLVDGGICRVIELLRHPRIRSGFEDFFGLGDGALHTGGTWCEY